MILLAFFVLFFVVGALMNNGGRIGRVKPMTPPARNDTGWESDGHGSSQPGYEGQGTGKRGW